MGFDCTVPLDSEPFKYMRIQIPGYDEVRIEDYISPNPATVGFET
jgi:2,5-furandicarboxylate decarboxylase 1